MFPIENVDVYTDLTIYNSINLQNIICAMVKHNMIYILGMI